MRGGQTQYARARCGEAKLGQVDLHEDTGFEPVVSAALTDHPGVVPVTVADDCQTSPGGAVGYGPEEPSQTHGRQVGGHTPLIGVRITEGVPFGGGPRRSEVVLLGDEVARLSVERHT